MHAPSYCRHAMALTWLPAPLLSVQDPAELVHDATTARMLGGTLASCPPAAGSDQ
jgi:hypothetical protein